MLLFGGTSNKPLVDEISVHSGISLGNLEITHFPDGERRVRVLDKVLDEDVLVVQSTSKKPDYYYFELFFIMDALKRSGARSLNLVIPYLGYQRQDHVFRDGEGVSLDVVINNLEGLGADKVITFDLHSIKIPELFKIPVVHLSAIPLFVKKIKEIGIDKENSVIVSPDMGGIRRAELLSESLSNTPFVSIEKNRDLETGDISSMEVDGNVGKTAFIVDDIISTGRTILAAVDLLKTKGVENIYIFATHPIFSFKEDDIFQDSIIKKVYLTDSVKIEENKKTDKMEILSIAELVSNQLK